jgi:5-methylcytosine-specific restriction endonuclease McrA
MSKRPNSTKTRRACFLYWRFSTPHGWRLKCGCGCGIEFNPATTAWDADHDIPREHGGSDDPPNVRPLLEACHRLKTSTKDIPEIAKGKRVSDSVYGVKRPKSKLMKPPGMKYDWERGRYVRE